MTATRIVLPVVRLVERVRALVAEAMSAHAAPVVSQRDQGRVRMPVPVHVPGSAGQASPTTVGPAIVGSAVFGGPAWPLIVAVAFDAAARAIRVRPVTRRGGGSRRRLRRRRRRWSAPPIAAQSDPSDAPPDAGHLTPGTRSVGSPSGAGRGGERLTEGGVPVIVG